MKHRLLGLIVAALCVQGCSVPYAEFYHDSTGGKDITKNPSIAPSTGEVQSYRGTDLDRDLVRMFEDGYVCVGYSSFNGGKVDESGAVWQAKRVHASVVLLYSKYTGTVSGMRPLVLPDVSTSSTSVNGSVGVTPFSGTASTTNWGTKTTYVPYSVARSDYFASYWIKTKPPRLGIHIRPLTPEDHQRINTNKGVLVFAVIKGSPAFEADVFKGDILLSIGDSSVYDEESLQKALAAYEGKETDVALVRGTQEIHKTIRLRTPE